MLEEGMPAISPPIKMQFIDINIWYIPFSLIFFLIEVGEDIWHVFPSTGTHGPPALDVRLLPYT
jgi:hypothetical protein